MKYQRFIYALAFVLLFAYGCSEDSSNTTTNTKPSTQAEEQQASVNEDYQNAVALYESNNLDEAMNIFGELLKSNPKDGQNDFYIGNIYRKKNDIDSAIRFYQSAIQKTPTLVAAYNNLAALQMAKESFDEALQTADKGLAVDSNFTDLKFKKGQILFVKQQYKESNTMLTETAKDPAFYESYRFIGLNYLQLSDKAHALENFRTYLKLAPEGNPFKEQIKQTVTELENK
ncbi:tetratricopeptide repeat protein [Brevibacillus migulae]|uniref:tetratricopeptide repeat protein n=1 Tax=Brevibacillus migulae TaxID=1644114 RepID=UPI0014320743|nr:tetratricopeptide repeat protein [Brevibacillus migulae]